MSSIFPMVPMSMNRFNITRFNTPINFKAKSLVAKKVRALMTRDLIKMAVYHSQTLNWDAEAFVDRPIKRWPKKRAKYGGKTLVKTGRLRQSIRVLRISKNLASAGTDVPYGKKHQLGDGFPVRQFIGHSAVLATASRKYITSQLNKAAKAPF